MYNANLNIFAKGRDYIKETGVQMDKLRKFMIGRYGTDNLNIALMVISIILMILTAITESFVLSMLSYIPLTWAVFRMFSKNIYHRSAENQKFLKIYTPIAKQLDLLIKMVFGSKTHKYYNCPSCKQSIRVPRGRGKIEITCPKCHNCFNKKT